MVRFASATVALALLAHFAFASDGVLDISQACATALTGCFSGDTAGFPVTITRTGSYRLTGNLVIADPNVGAIVISTSNVTIDLGGFEISGPVTFTPGVGCSASGGGSGIATVGVIENVVVKDGRVRGMGYGGVAISPSFGSRIERVVAEHNCGTGLVVGSTGQIIDSQARLNGDDGIWVGNSSRLRDSISDRNAFRGIVVGAHSIVTGCVSTSNGQAGI